MAAIEPPTLRDGTLTLRPSRPSDVDTVTAACQDPEIQRWTLVPTPYRREHAEEWLARAPASALAGEAVHLLAFEEGRLVGSFSVMEIDHARGYGEIGYWVAAEARGRGLATRAVGMMREWAHEILGLTLIEILPDRENAASRRVAERAGFTDTGELRRALRRPDDAPPRYMVDSWEA